MQTNIGDGNQKIQLQKSFCDRFESILMIEIINITPIMSIDNCNSTQKIHENGRHYREEEKNERIEWIKTNGFSPKTLTNGSVRFCMNKKLFQILVWQSKFFVRFGIKSSLNGPGKIRYGMDSEVMMIMIINVTILLEKKINELFWVNSILLEIFPDQTFNPLFTIFRCDLIAKNECID